MQTEQDNPAVETKASLTDKQRYWLEKINEATSSGQTLSDYAKANELDPQKLYQYQHVLRQKGALKVLDKKPGFSKVRVDRKSAPLFPEKQTASLYFPNGLRLDFPLDIDVASLSTLVSQLWPYHAAPR